MLYVYKRSSQPMHALANLRCGGPNNICSKISAKFLVLWNVQVVLINNAWHYVFEFDARDTLVLSRLAQLALGASEQLSYRGDVDWARWLGEDWEVVDEHVRDEILEPTSAGPSPQVVITDLRETPSGVTKPPRPPVNALDNSLGFCFGLTPPTHPALPSA